MAACPICEGAVAPYPENPSAPFCGQRCKTIDLGNWIDERYRIAGDVSTDSSSRLPTDEGQP